MNLRIVDYKLNFLKPGKYNLIFNDEYFIIKNKKEKYVFLKNNISYIMKKIYFNYYLVLIVLKDGRIMKFITSKKINNVISKYIIPINKDIFNYD